MPDPGMIPEKKIEAVRLALIQANNSFIEKLHSVSSGEELREAFHDLLNQYTENVDTSSADVVKASMPLFIEALNNLNNLSPELKETVDSHDYDQVCKQLDGFPDDFVDNNAELMDKWADEIDKLFQELEAIN